jgi:hypothetical protein
VAFLGGRPVAPLLAEIRTAPTLAAAVQQWERSWPGGGRTLADWLHRNDLLEPVEGRQTGDQPPRSTSA